MQAWRSDEHYRKRAQELRDAAEHLTDEAAKENLLALAKEYEAMAEKGGGGESDQPTGLRS